MGLPEINIIFKEKAETAVLRSERGIVALILNDSTKTVTSYTYSYESDIKTSDWTKESLELMNLVFKGSPKAVIVERLSDKVTVQDALGRLKNKKWNYLTFPKIDSQIGDVETVKNWIIAQRAANKTFKAVLPKSDSTGNFNDEGIIEFATDNVKAGSKTYSVFEYCARIAGVLAGLPLTQSATYYVLPEVDGITESTTPDADIDAGRMILINDGEKVKIAKGVNSLHTLSGIKTEDMKQIKVVDGMDLIRDDIRTTFEENYIGVNNSTDNKQLFIGAVSQYLDSLTRQGVLYDGYDNSVSLDTDAIREFLIEQGYDVSEMTDDEIKRANTGTYVFARADVQFMNSIENLTFTVGMN